MCGEDGVVESCLDNDSRHNLLLIWQQWVKEQRADLEGCDISGHARDQGRIGFSPHNTAS